MSLYDIENLTTHFDIKRHPGVTGSLSPSHDVIDPSNTSVRYDDVSNYETAVTTTSTLVLRLTELVTAFNSSGREPGPNVSDPSGHVLNSEQPLYAKVIIVLMYVLIILVAVGGNLLFSYVIVMHPKMRSVTNLFLLNLAISDIVKAVICNPFAFIANLILLYWPYGEFMCQVVTYVQVVAVFLSAFTLVAMSVDRYVAILNPMRPRLSKRAFAITMATIWILSLSAPLPTAITSRVTNNTGLCLEQFENDHNRYIYSIVIMMLQYFVPLAVITVTNTHIGYIVWIKKTPGEAEEDRDRRMAASKRRLVKMIIIVVVIYAVCWLPLHVITLVGDHNPDFYNRPHMNVVWLCAHWLAMSHSCYNPFVYFSLSATFRRNLKRLTHICRLKQKRLRQHLSMRTSRADGWDKDTEVYGSAESIRSKVSAGSLHSSNKGGMRVDTLEEWQCLKEKKLKGVTNDMYL